MKKGIEKKKVDSVRSKKGKKGGHETPLMQRGRGKRKRKLSPAYEGRIRFGRGL